VAQSEARRRAAFPERHRDQLVAVLTLAAGATDALAFLGLGGVFTSVMTANLVLLGLSAGHLDATLTEHAAVALAGFVTGALSGGRLAAPADEPGPAWPRRVTAVLAIETVLLAVVTAGWEAAPARPSGAAQLALVAAAALAMGLQSAAVRGLGVGGLSSTYLTGTLTTMLGELAAGGGPRSARRRLPLLAMLIIGAALSGILVVRLPRLAPLLPLAALIGVVTAAVGPGRRAG
jgi:uncharacterized membrane protein YoaK (UPF0700 family)